MFPSLKFAVSQAFLSERLSFLGEHVFRSGRPEEIKLVEISRLFTNFLPIENGEGSGSREPGQVLVKALLPENCPDLELPSQRGDRQALTLVEADLCLQLSFSVLCSFIKHAF